MTKLFILLLPIIFIISACTVSPNSAGIVIKVNSKEDIPNIKEQYKEELERLYIGMPQAQVKSMFPYAETECYPSRVCHITIFNETLISVDKRIGDLNLLTGSLMSMFALTCLLSEDDCVEAIFAAFNVGIAAAVDSNRIKKTPNQSGVITLIQWINIETSEGKVTQWAINEPLPQYQPKSFKNKLPPLEDSLNLK